MSREVVATERHMLDALNDTARADEAAETLRHGLVSENGTQWLEWDGKRWLEVPDARALEVVRQWHYDYSRDVLGNLPAKDIGRFLGIGAISATLKLLAGILMRRADEFDAHPHLLNVANGVLDLRTGELSRHDPHLLLTRLAPVDYKPGATHKDWQAALTALPKSARGYARMRFGQAITGHTPDDDTQVFLIGGGSNGKSTMLDAVRHALGDYATVVPDEVLLARPGDHPASLMTLKGVRLAVAEELPDGHRINVKRLKDITGTEVITARRMRQDFVSFPATHSLFVSTNYLPIVSETDHGTWRRLVPLTFPREFVRGTPARKGQRKGDRHLRTRLRRGTGGRSEAVLAWLVAGAREWFDDGMRLPLPPQRVEDDARAWRKETDVIMRFVDDALAIESEAFTLSSELYGLFSGWQAVNGLGKWSMQTFSARLAQHDDLAGRVELTKTYAGRGWRGIALRDDARVNVEFARQVAHLTPAPTTITTD
ncbi:DNA primase family protein [Microbacterium sp. As-52]|uniref:DNA primase family protein n=1 Tax=Microbacterium sp. As-52 TaxID=3390503 RepID=UPI003CE954E4